MLWPAIRIPRRSRRLGTVSHRARDTPDMTVRLPVAAAARPVDLLWCVAATLLLAACQSVPRPAAPAAAPEEEVVAGWPARRSVLQSRPQFTAQGRIGVVAGADGFNGRLRWVQEGARSTVS